MEWLKMQEELASNKAEDSLKLAQESASKLDGLELTIPMKVGEEGLSYRV